MKKNSTKIILLIAVAGIWGYVGYLIYGYINPSDEVSFSTPKVSKGEDTKVKQKNTLQLDYPDPFLRKPARKPKRQTSPSVAKTPASKIPQKSAVKWPKIKYMGYVKGSSTLIMLNYNGDTKIVTQGEKLDSFHIGSYTPEKLSIYYKGEHKEYTK